MKDFSISKNKSKIRITLFLLLCLIISFFTACDNLLFNEKLKEIISDDIGTSFSFFEYDDESSQHIDKTYIIGKTVSSKDFPEFLHEETMIVGWQYLKNPNTDSTEMPSNYYLNERDYISSINVSPEPAYLYAVWKKKCTITFVTGCDVQLEPYVLPEGYTIPFDDYNKWNQNLTKPKFAFRDWYLDENCTELFDYTLPVTGNITLYAKWVEQITVTYHSNDGRNRTNSNIYDVGFENLYIDDCFFGERSGYGFVGWAKSAAATTPDYYYSDSIPILMQDTDLYAVWSTDIITITYKENCNIPGIAQNRTRQVHYGKGAHVSIGRYFIDYGWDWIYYDWNKTGYEIKGYDFSASATEDNMQFNEWGYDYNEALQYYLLTSDITLYAVWGAKKYEVYFVWEETDDLGITYQNWCYDYLPVFIDYNTAIPRPATDPVRPGYTFEDWYIREWNYITQDYEYKLYDFSTILNEENFGLNTDIRIYAKFTEVGSTIDASISFYADPEQDISVTVTQSSSTYIFTADPGYESYQWTLDGSTQSSTGNILEVDTSSLYVGIHDLYLKAKDSYGNWYSYYGKITKE